MAMDGGRNYTILLLGRIGMGKSTFGNALLGDGKGVSALPLWHDSPKSSEATSQSSLQAGCGEVAIQQFNVGSGVNPTTMNCQVLFSKEKNITVMDTPGFGRHFAHHSITSDVYKENKELFSMIVQCQNSYNIRFNAIVYFLPFRGPPERSEGNFIQEISLINRFIGNDAINRLILVCTNNSRLQFVKFNEEMFQISRNAFAEALKTVQVKCLMNEIPLFYLPMSCDEPGIFDCITHNYSSNIKPPIKLLLQDECSKCKGKLVYSEDAMDCKNYTHFYKQYDDDLVAIEVSKCHPRFVTAEDGLWIWCQTKASELVKKTTSLVLYGDTQHCDKKLPNPYCISCKKEVGSPGCLRLMEAFNVTIMQKCQSQDSGQLGEREEHHTEAITVKHDPGNLS